MRSGKFGFLGSFSVAGGGGEPAIGAPYAGGYYAGTITYPDARVFRLVVADISGEVAALQWKTSRTTSLGTGSYYDGVANTTAMDTAEHPAAQHCTGYSGSGESDWYLGSRDEWQVIHDNLSPNLTTVAEFQTGGPQAMSASTSSANQYWTSTEANSANCFVMWLIYNLISAVPKDSSRRVRPIRRILVS
jgi:hypothetical protein